MFFLFTGGLFGLLILQGAGTFAVVMFGSSALAIRMITLFATMFAGMLGLGTGYLVGAAAEKRDRSEAA